MFRCAQMAAIRNRCGDLGDFGNPSTEVCLSDYAHPCGCMVALLSYLIAISGQHYGDGRYFIRQITMHVEYGRRLYDQIELPYGPLLFYGPVIVHVLFCLRFTLDGNRLLHDTCA